MCDITTPDRAASITPADQDARDAFLDRYTDYTRKLYASDLRVFYRWCGTQGLSPLACRRRELERFIEHLTSDHGNLPSSVTRRMHALRGYYALAVDDDVIDRDPTRMLRLPKRQRRVDELVWLNRYQVGRFLHEAQRTSPAHHALIGLMALGGLRVSAACTARLEDITPARYGLPTLSVLEKNRRIHTLELSPELSEIIAAAADGRDEGPIVLRRNGRPQDRNGAYAWVRILGEKVGIRANPHAFRRAGITAILDGGGTIQQAREFAGHAYTMTTELYDRNGGARGASGALLTAAAFGAVA